MTPATITYSRFLASNPDKMVIFHKPETVTVDSPLQTYVRAIFHSSEECSVLPVPAFTELSAVAAQNPGAIIFLHPNVLSDFNKWALITTGSVLICP